MQFCNQKGTFSTLNLWFAYFVWSKMSIKGINMFPGLSNTILKRKLLIILDFENGLFPAYFPLCFDGFLLGGSIGQFLYVRLRDIWRKNSTPQILLSLNFAQTRFSNVKQFYKTSFSSSWKMSKKSHPLLLFISYAVTWRKYEWWVQWKAEVEKRWSHGCQRALRYFFLPKGEPGS